MTTQIGPDGKRFTLEEPTPDDAPGDTQTVGSAVQDPEVVAQSDEPASKKVARKVRSVRKKIAD